MREGEAGVLSIAAVTGLGHNILPRAVHRFRASHPKIAVMLQTATGPEVVARVAQGRADLGFSVGPAGHPSIESEVLCRTRIGCVLPAGHHLADKAGLEPDDIATEAIICPGPHLSIGAAILGAFAEANRPLRIAVETSQSTIACELVRTGVGAYADVRLSGRRGDLGSARWQRRHAGGIESPANSSQAIGFVSATAIEGDPAIDATTTAA